MGGPWVDRLAVAVAAPSRRRLLRLLVGAGGAALARPGSPAAAIRGRSPGAAAAGNVQTGSCQALSAYRAGTGVTDADGVAHPGWAGVTTANYSYSIPAFDYKGHKGGGGYCLRTEPVSLGFTGTPAVERLDWQPTEAISDTCRERVGQWTDQVEEHEDHHVQDVHDAVADANARWAGSPRPYEACAGTRAKALKRVKGQMRDDAQAEIARIRADVQEGTDAFHATPEGGPAPDPDCGVCATCPTVWCGGGWGGGAALADRPYCCHRGCWQEGSIDCGGYCCPPRTTCCGPTQRCCAEGFVCITDCPTDPPYACCRAGATCC